MLEKIFSIKNEYKNNKKYKLITVLGFKIKLSQQSFGTIYNNNFMPPNGIVYKDNEELGLGNINIKLKRVEEGGPFEYEDMIVANKTIGKYFLNNKKNVVNIGAGVGTFENCNADSFPNINFVASEFDIPSTKWCQEYRNKDNVTYCTDDIKTLIQKYNKFDLAISIDVIEHIKNYKSFLDDFSQLSDYAVISTPNRDRFNCLNDLKSPPYKYHVQEFNIGELYFILKMYYKTVRIYSFQNPLIDKLTEVGIYSTYEKIIAYCEK